MISNVVVLTNETDTFTIGDLPKISIALNASSHKEFVRNSIYDVLAKFGAEPAGEAIDFLNIAISAYTADVRTPREQGFDRWTRNFHLHMPVQFIDKWLRAKTVLEKSLSFLTGDHWVFHFRACSKESVKPKVEKVKKIKKFKPQAVSLFSGGLDSFIGALDLLSAKHPIALVGHHAAGDGPTSVSQKRVFELIEKHFDPNIVSFIPVWVSPKKQEDPFSENTTRGRSLLFVAIGLAIASAFGTRDLYIPENGLISLNVPLTNSRLGSFSTRTTHPYFIFLVRQLLLILGIPTQLILPYRHKTKGEMVTECREQSMMEKGLPLTMSCSHPSAGRYAGIRGMPHCGYCVPCIIRQAAIKHSRKDPTQYAYKLGGALKGRKELDCKVFRMALNRYKAKLPTLFDILAAGPLPGTADDRINYLSVFKRGLQEVRELLP